MKIFIGLMALVVAAGAIDPEFVKQVKQKMMRQIESCAKEVSATPDDVLEIFSHKIPSSHEGKCIFFCMHKLYNAQNDDGSLNMAGALSNLELIKDMDNDLYNKMVTSFKNCEATPVDSDPCIFASSLVECVVREGKAAGLEEVVIE